MDFLSQLGAVLEDVSERVDEAIAGAFEKNGSTLEEETESETPLVEWQTYKLARPEENVVRYVIGIVELLVFLIGTPANCFVLYITNKVFHRRGGGARDRENGYFRHSRWLVLTMTSFDLLFCLVHAPMMVSMYLLPDYIPQNYVSCTIMYFVTHSSTTGSSLSLLALNVEKFIRLYKPLHYRTMITKRRTVTASVLIWAVSISWSTFILFGPSMEHGVTKMGQCKLKIKHSEVYALFAAQFFILPTLISLVICVFTLATALKIRRNRGYPYANQREFVMVVHQSQSQQSGEEQEKLQQVHNSDSFASPPTAHNDSASLHHIATNNESKNGGKQHEEKVGNGNSLSLFQVVGFVFSTTIWTSLTTLPYRIGYLSVITMNPSSISPLTVVCLFYLLVIMVTNAAGNPFITIATKRQYSNFVRRLLKREPLSESYNLSSTRETV